MKKVYLLLVISTIAMSCGLNQRSMNSSMDEEEFQEYNKQKNDEGQIAIETTFEPTLELTDEIRNSTLEDLIKQGKGKLSRYDQQRQKTADENERRKLKSQGYSKKQIEEMMKLPRIRTERKSACDFAREYKLKYVPKTSNLAKVYYLEDMGMFIEHNHDFYYNIISKLQEESQKQLEQKNWDKYL